MVNGAATLAGEEPALSWREREPCIPLGLGFLISEWH